MLLESSLDWEIIMVIVVTLCLKYGIIFVMLTSSALDPPAPLLVVSINNRNKRNNGLLDMWGETSHWGPLLS